MKKSVNVLYTCYVYDSNMKYVSEWSEELEFDSVANFVAYVRGDNEDNEKISRKIRLALRNKGHYLWGRPLVEKEDEILREVLYVSENRS